METRTKVAQQLNKSARQDIVLQADEHPFSVHWASGTATEFNILVKPGGNGGMMSAEKRASICVHSGYDPTVWIFRFIRGKIDEGILHESGVHR
jgi:hypothetical protein